jgi:serine/threonine protein phosphatase PrpC
MEDTHITEQITLPNNQKAMLFGVFDGHGGKEVAAFA